MKLFKFRSLSNVDHTLDILLNERLHCAPYDKLNDPFEGIFISVTHLGSMNSTLLGSMALGSHRTVKRPRSISSLYIPSMLGGKRVCSLSESKSDVRLWSHYSAGHAGIAIEIDLDADIECLHKVDYVEQLKEFGNTLMTAPNPSEILKIKSKHWEYEQEYRLISEEEFFSISGKITGIYLGLRTSDHMREMLLRVVGKSIPIYSTKLNEQKIEIETNQRIN